MFILRAFWITLLTANGHLSELNLTEGTSDNPSYTRVDTAFQCQSNFNETLKRVNVNCASLKLRHVPPCEALPVDCHQITHLDLTNTGISYISPGAFSKFTTLEYLDLTDNPIKALQDGTFRGMNQLKRLIITGNTIYNGRYKSSPGLNYSDNLFRDLPNLDYLDLSASTANIPQLFLRALCSLPAGITSLFLSYLYPSQRWSSAVMTLDYKMSRCLRHTKLKTLDLSKNSIAIVKADFLFNVRHLEFFSLRNNKILGDRDTIYTLAFLRNLKFLDLGCQVWPDDCGVYDHDILALTSDVGPHSFLNSTELLTSATSSGSDLYVLPHLHTLRLDHFTGRFGSVDFHRHNICWRNNHLVNLDISYAHTGDFIGVFPCMFNLKFFNLRGIHTKFIDPIFFHQMPSLEVLLLSSSYIPTIFQDDGKAANTFKRNTRLRHLELSKLGLNSLNSRLIEGLQMLETLNVSRNKLSHIGNIFSNHTLMRTIDVSFNELTRIPISLLNLLEHNQKSKQDAYASLYLSGNPFICTCETLQVLERFSYSTVHVVHLNSRELSCTLADGQRFIFKQALTVLKRRCQTFDPRPIIVLFIFYPLSLISILLSSLGYRNRWTIKYAWYTALEMMRRSGPKDDHFIFDAFVSYSSEDEFWVQNELVKHLEDSGIYSYKLCLHYRHFVPGRCIVDNIVSAVKASKKVILVVTKHYIRSGWCDFETKFAQVHHLRKNGGGIIAIVHPEVTGPMRRRAPTLDAVLDTVTYLEWPIGAKTRLLWMSLRRALGTPVNRPEGSTDYDLILL